MSDANRGGQGRWFGAVQQDDRHGGAGLSRVDFDDRNGQGCGVALQQMQKGGHQNTMKREAPDTRAAMASVVMGTTGCPSAFHPGSVGSAERSTWNGTPSFLSDARYFAMSSPSTRSSVSSSSRCVAGPVRTMWTSFSPATTPSAMRIASFARWDTRGSSEMTTRVGWRSATGCRVTSRGDATLGVDAALVQREKALGAVDEVGQHDEATIGRLLGERLPALLATVGAGEQLESALGQRLHARILDRRDCVVDQIEVDTGATIERHAAQAERRLEIGMIGRCRHHQTECSFRQIHHELSVAPAAEERQ